MLKNLMLRFRPVVVLPRLAGSFLACALTILATAAFGQQPTGNPLKGLEELKDFRARRSSSSDPNWRNGNADARPIAPGATLVIADLKGPGEISHLWNTVASSERGYSRLLVLRMYWDGEQNPSVECPLGDFFAIGHGLDVPFDSLPVRVTSDGRGRNCYWPMPFRKSARLTVTNEGRKPVDAFYYYVDWRQLPRLNKNAAYFHAQYRQEFPTVMGRNYVLADIVGRGHYVGTVLSWRQLTPSWPGEGDDFWFIDGETEPSLRGTGTEDYFCDGWGFRKQAGPYYGAPLMEGNETGNRTSVYRWHIPDPVPFQKSLRLEFEHKGVTFNPDGSVKSGFEERSDDFSSVAYWYQVEPHKPFPPLPRGFARLNYDPSQIVYGEKFVANATATEGRVERQVVGSGPQLLWVPSRSDQVLTVNLEVPEGGNYEPTLILTHSWDYGIYQLELDGKPLSGPIDFYGPTVTDQDYTYPARNLEAGRHTLTIHNVGKNTQSKGYLFGLLGVLLQKR
ncbi:MAG: DUF2961 domain-containing protein [Abitibacteriaceae bacterium]|nr:DUF2961 domain-containing protein [Abditibacteriaceae bacterium]MBV9867707.1 DUF2961 domain-containing protein [Abditibacteriaceae bacterium]